VKTASVRVGSNVTIGLGSIIAIGVEIGDCCKVGALSFVPKHGRLEGGAIYAGIPAQRIGSATDAHTLRQGGNGGKVTVGASQSGHRQDWGAVKSKLADEVSARAYDSRD